MEKIGNISSCSPPAIFSQQICVNNINSDNSSKECDFCASNRKVVYLCRCGKKCCMRDLMGHRCTYDYKNGGKKELEEKNPKIKDSKNYTVW